MTKHLGKLHLLACLYLFGETPDPAKLIKNVLLATRLPLTRPGALEGVIAQTRSGYTSGLAC